MIQWFILSFTMIGILGKKLVNMCTQGVVDACWEDSWQDAQKKALKHQVKQIGGYNKETDTWDNEDEDEYEPAPQVQQPIVMQTPQTIQQPTEVKPNTTETEYQGDVKLW